MADDAIMQPTRDPRATLPDLIEVLLNKGVYLNLDLIISVSDIPLIGVNLRATIAGIETMLEYGMMRQWDEDTRKWVQQSVRAHLPLAEDEEIIAKMAGGHYQDNFYRTWRPGSAYLTSQRLIIHRRDPAETLWQAKLSSIESIAPLSEPSIGGEERIRILVRLDDGSESKLSALEPERLIRLVQEQRGAALQPSTGQASSSSPQPLKQGRMWYLEALSGGGTWRGGEGTLTGHDLTWKSPMDSRALVRISASQVRNLHWEKHDNPTGKAHILFVETERSSIRLAADDIDGWYDELEQWSASEQQDPAVGNPREKTDEGESWH